MKSEEPVTTKMMWKCTHCDKEFKYESEKRRHEQSHVPQFECKVCCKKFSFLSALRRHEKQHERTGSVQCNKCGGSFRDDLLLKRHVQYAHKGKHTCTNCSATFNSDTALQTHMKTHKPKSERRFRCSFEGCGKTFNFPHHLKHHELTHTNTKPHFCKICGKGFIQSYQLKMHQRTHEPDSWLPCPVTGCNKKLPDKYARKRHLETHKSSDVTASESDATPDASILINKQKDKILCTTCDRFILQRLYVKHTSKCTSIEKYDAKELSVRSLQISIQDIEIKSESDLLDKLDAKDNYKNDSKGSDKIDSSCKGVIGSCIVSEDNDIHDNCLCAQITTTVDENFDLMIPEDKIAGVDASKLNRGKVINDCQRRIETNSCEGCECADSCSYRIVQNASNLKQTESPVMEYRADGILKLKEICDIDIPYPKVADMEDFKSYTAEVSNDSKREIKYLKRVPFYSCRDVLGNCIVSGNGTMGEGCLCAKMIADDQQMIAQEIEEITPCPKSTWN